jgi:hypothetical protein
MVPGVLDWLATVTDSGGGVPFVLPSCTAYPRGPWWQPTPGDPGALNPTGALVGHLYALGVSDHPWLEAATDFCWRGIEALTETSPYEMRAILDFLEEVPNRDRAARAWEHLGPMFLPHIALEPGAEGDVHPPLRFATRPDSIARPLFDDAVIAAHLDALEAAQQDDGSWGFGWEPWTPITVPEWRGWVTIESLLTLRAYGRL